MASLLVSGLFTKSQDGKDGDVKQFRFAITDVVKRNESKLSSFSIDSGVITMTIDDETTAGKVKDELSKLEGVKITVVGSALEATEQVEHYLESFEVQNR